MGGYNAGLDVYGSADLSDTRPPGGGGRIGGCCNIRIYEPCMYAFACNFTIYEATREALPEHGAGYWVIVG